MKSEPSFTLIELLVVIAILALLFGLAALALSSAGDNTEAIAANREVDMVQTALDVCFATDTCTNPGAQADFAVVGPSSGEFGAYLRQTSRFLYTWDASGKITGQQNSDGNTFYP